MYNDQTPTVTPVQPVHPTQRHFLAAFFLSFMWGVVGVDRFYLGKIGTGIAKLLTFGGLGIWVIVDLALIMSGSMRNKQGRQLLEVERYKKFANRTVLWFAIILGVTTLASGLIAVWEVYPLITHLLHPGAGGLNQFLPRGAGSSNTDITTLLKQYQ